MVEVEWTTAQPGGVALVAVRLDNRVAAPGVDAHRVRLAARVDGPVWPPRVEGVPAGEWRLGGDGHREREDDGRGSNDAREHDASEDGARENDAGDDEPASVEVVVPTGRVGSVGFASPGEPADPPVEVESVEPAGDASDVDPSAEDVLRVLGDPSPPRDVVGPELAAGSPPERPADPADSDGPERPESPIGPVRPDGSGCSESPNGPARPEGPG